MPGLTEAELAEGASRYESNKEARRIRKRRYGRRDTAKIAAGCSEDTQVGQATTRLCQLMLPSDCTKSGTVFGGAVMKLMDNASGITCARHCRTNVVTASMDALDFL